jgi:hypothetical protein
VVGKSLPGREKNQCKGPVGGPYVQRESKEAKEQEWNGGEESTRR